MGTFVNGLVEISAEGGDLDERGLCFVVYVAGEDDVARTLMYRSWRM